MPVVMLVRVDVTNPFQRGPDPTAGALEAAGPYAVTAVGVPDGDTVGFRAATIHHPTTTADGTFGGVAVVPGFVERQAAVGWYGPRLASHGFVVITFDTRSLLDDPAARGEQLLAALDHLTSASSARSRVDGSRLAVMGHSMGGGAALEAARARRSLRAAVPLAGWHLDASWPEVETPTLVIGAQFDVVAAVAFHSQPVYESLPVDRPKAYLEIAAADHFVTNRPTRTVSRLTVAWLKRFVDDDTRYTPFLCPPPPATGPISEYRSTCPYDRPLLTSNGIEL